MNRRVPLLLVLALSAAAGAWLFAAPTAPVPVRVAETASCEGGSTCDAGIVPTTQPPVAPPAPPPPPKPAATPAADPDEGRRLREESDRDLAEGRYLEALDSLRKATELDPTARNHGDLGLLLERMTAIDEALIHLRRAADLDPGNADRWIDLANAYYRKVEPGEAWKAEARAREAEPGLVLGRDAGGFRIRKSDSGADKK